MDEVMHSHGCAEIVWNWSCRMLKRNSPKKKKGMRWDESSEAEMRSLCNYSNFTTQWRCNMWPAAGSLVATELLFKQPRGGTINAPSVSIVCLCLSAYRAACFHRSTSHTILSTGEPSPLPYFAHPGQKKVAYFPRGLRNSARPDTVRDIYRWLISGGFK